MSCLHGNHPDACDICDEVDAAYERGAASRDQALFDLEAENARLQSIADGNAELYQHELLRAEKARALMQAMNDSVDSNSSRARADALLAKADSILREWGFGEDAE